MRYAQCAIQTAHCAMRLHKAEFVMPQKGNQKYARENHERATHLPRAARTRPIRDIDDDFILTSSGDLELPLWLFPIQVQGRAAAALAVASFDVARSGVVG